MVKMQTEESWPPSVFSMNSATRAGTMRLHVPTTISFPYLPHSAGGRRPMDAPWCWLCRGQSNPGSPAARSGLRTCKVRRGCFRCSCDWRDRTRAAVICFRHSNSEARGNTDRTRFYLFGNATIAQGLFRYSAAAGLGAPVRFCVSQRDGEETRIDIDLPTSFFSQFPEMRNSSIPAELDERMLPLLENIAG